jgi:2-polyprenyl-3-methyl-5-hydroxy-6-metoxy-1,4-benzoquinol methylase
MNDGGVDNQGNLVLQQYWDEGYRDLHFEIAHKGDQVRNWIESYIPQGNGSCLEIGCFPGRYLAIFGRLGYELNGIDLTPRTLEMVDWLMENGYRTGEFYQEDFFHFNPEKQFDVVSSFGFIEHFLNWAEVLRKQAGLVKKGGYLVVSVPNFRGVVQQLLHFHLDRENYNRHYILSMNPDEWVKIIELEKFQIVYLGYFSKFDFWGDHQKRSFLQLLGKYAMHALTPIIGILLPRDKEAYAPYCGLIAKKVSG